jgi:uncharacterized protein (DUF2252 family)
MLISTRAQRVERGRAARAIVRRRDLGRWDENTRSQDALALVLEQSASRVPDLVPIRHARMAASPWHYYRGAAAVMAADLAIGPTTGLSVQLCGDAHLLNFGLWATPERALAFDLRDFDETLPAPFEWDVRRLITSIVVAAQDAGKARRAEPAVRACLRAYRGHLTELTTTAVLDNWYDITRIDRLLEAFNEPEWRERAAAHIHRKSKQRTSRGALERLTEVVNGRPQITENSPYRVHLDDAERAHALRAFAGYRQSLDDHLKHLLDRFELVDVVRQVVGVGSVGMRVYLLLLEGPGGDDPLFLQMKQAGPSVYEAHVAASRYANHGQRVVNGKRLIQSATDIFVGWTEADDVHYYIRQFRDMKIVPDIRRIAPVMVDFAAACGAVLARAHARTGDAVSIASYIGKGRAFDAAMTRFAFRYAEQNARDHARLASAAAAADVPTSPGG